MVNLYATLIINKRRTLKSCPKNLQAKISERLTELGFDDNGDPILDTDEAGI